MTPREADAEVAEYVLGLDAIGLGARAHQIRKNTLSLEVRAVLIRQAALLGTAIRLGRQVEYGKESTPGIDQPRANALAREALALDAEIVAAWGRCLEQLKIMYLTEEAA